MKFYNSFLVGMASLFAATFVEGTVPGFDISHYQATVDFKAAYSSGARFVIIKATEGTTYKDPKFSSHYTSATSAGFIRGGYHFAQPASSSGAAQAKYFVANGGGWSGDGITLPGMLDLEYGASSACYGLSATSMVNWISDFVNTYHSSTGRYPLIYTSTSWWKTCTGNTNKFASNCPLVVARYASAVGELPAGWGYYTIWQNSDSYKYGGDSDVFNGALSQLQKLASG